MWFEWKSSWVHNQSKNCRLVPHQLWQTCTHLAGTWRNLVCVGRIHVGCLVWNVTMFMMYKYFNACTHPSCANMCCWLAPSAVCDVWQPVDPGAVVGLPFVEWNLLDVPLVALLYQCPASYDLTSKLENVSLQKHSYREGGIPVGSFSFVSLYGLV